MLGDAALPGVTSGHLRRRSAGTTQGLSKTQTFFDGRGGWDGNHLRQTPVCVAVAEIMFRYPCAAF